MKDEVRLSGFWYRMFSFLIACGRFESIWYSIVILPAGSSINRGLKRFHANKKVRFRGGGYRLCSFRTIRNLVLDSMVRIFFGPVWTPGFSFSIYDQNFYVTVRKFISFRNFEVKSKSEFSQYRLCTDYCLYFVCTDSIWTVQTLYRPSSVFFHVQTKVCTIFVNETDLSLCEICTCTDSGQLCSGIALFITLV